MNNWTLFFLEINGIILVMYLVLLLFRKQFSFSAQRWMTLFIPMVALGVLGLKYNFSESIFSYNIPVVELDTIELNSASKNAMYEINYWAIAYSIGAGLMLSLFIYKLVKVIWFFRKSSWSKSWNCHLIETDNKESFSFFNRVHLQSDLSENDKQVVMEHELIHSAKLHSLDLLIMEVYHSLFWFNPMLYVMKKELVKIHEFEVDNEMYSKHKKKYIVHLLEHTLQVQSDSYLLTSQFSNELSLTKRIQKMRNTKINKKGWIWAIPLVGLSFTFISWTTPQPTQTKTEVPGDPQKEDLDKQPEFNGGMNALVSYLGKEIKYPESAKKGNVEGKVIVEFTVTKNGKVKDATIKRGVSQDLDDEALRVISGMPNWNPGEKEGKKVDAKMVLPISFKL